MKTLFGFGLSQQAMIGEPRVPPCKMDSRRSQSHSPYTDRHGDSSWLRWWRKQDKMYKHTYAVRLSVRRKTTKFHFIMNKKRRETEKKRKEKKRKEKKEGPGGPLAFEK